MTPENSPQRHTPAPSFHARECAAGILIALGMCSFAGAAQAQMPAPGSLLYKGVDHLRTLDFALDLDRSSQTVTAMKPIGGNGFDFNPGDQLAARSGNGYYQLGDLDLRLRAAGTGPWQEYSSAYRRAPVKALPVEGDDLASADLAPTFPAAMPLDVVRTWTIDGENLALQFTLKNTSKQPVEIGALGIPLIFNNILTDRTLEQASAECSFDDPYMGEDAGYVQVTRLNGHGPALLVVPEEHTPLEAWRPILDRRGPDGKIAIFNDPTPRGITFEGFYEWMAISGAYTQNEWKNAQPWNPGTTVTLAPGASRTFGVRFLLAPTIPAIEQTLAKNFRPIAVGVPGYVLPKDIHAQLFLRYQNPVASIQAEPAGAIAITAAPTTPAGWTQYHLEGKTWGRARVVVTYKDGTVQSIGYDVIEPVQQAVADLGRFSFTQQWFTDAQDPFHRAPSVITYDHQAGKQVTEEPRVWIAGLSDEAGSGSWLAAGLTQLAQPNKDEVARYEQFIDGTLWGGIQDTSGPLKYGVRKSLFYYQPDALPAGYYNSADDWKTWASWNKKASEAVDRSYNYPHVVTAYWVMYRLARDHQGLVTNHPWQWYLSQAYETTMAMMRLAPYYTQFGQMEGDVFLNLLRDLQREGWTAQASTMEAVMRERAEAWNQKEYPFGSEMPWDSTGQEEVYAWTHYFGYNAKAQVTLDAILGYDPSIPSWGYNGSARRYWDFLYAGKIARIERQLHHYGSGINAIPLLSAYREHPQDLDLLRIGYGGTLGPLTNIAEDGFASEAFHSFASTMKFDAYSGDYGPNFFGYAMDAATYVTNSPDFGWLCFGGNLTHTGTKIDVTPLDGIRQRVYLAPYGLWLTLDAGRFRDVRFDPATREVLLTLDPADSDTHQALLRIEQPAAVPGVGHFAPQSVYATVRGAYAVALTSGATQITLAAPATHP